MGAKMGRLGVKSVVDYWKTVDLQLIKHSLHYVQEGSLMCPSWRKTVNIDLGEFYLHFHHTHFTPDPRGGGG